MQRGLAAHMALCSALQTRGVPARDLPDRLRDAIKMARARRMITNREEHWLLLFNQEANQAKHELGRCFELEE